MGNVSKEGASVAVLKTILKQSQMCAESGCKPEPPKFPSTPLNPCHKGI
ncbi:hypothetical protein GXV17_005408 [Escherichia coli]|nr:hypothetical protein [Escherichia coli]